MVVARVLDSYKCVLGPQQQAIFLNIFTKGAVPPAPKRGTPQHPRQIFLPPSVAAL